MSELPHTNNVGVSKSCGAAAVVGEYGIIAFRPAPTKILQARRIILLNQTAGQVTIAIRIAKASSLTAAALGGAGLAQGLGLCLTGSQNAEGLSASLWQAGTYANINSSAGVNICEVQMNAGDSFPVIFDDADPLLVWGTDQGGPVPGIVVSQKNTNQIVACTFIGREFDHP